MAANRVNLTGASDTTSFRNVGSAIAGQLSGFGWVNTADTGQINWSTVTFAGSGYTLQGYSIWRPADTLQATAPFFVKFYWYTSTFNGNIQIGVQIGTGTDGAGNLTGQMTQQFILNGTYASTTQQQYCYFSGDTSRFQMCLWDGPVTSASQVLVSIERSKTSAGADNSDGLIVNLGATTVSPNGAGVGLSQFVPYVAGSGIVGDTQPAWMAAVNQAQFTMSFGTSTGVAPPIPFYQRPYNYGMGVLVYQGTDYAWQSTPSIPIYGSNHTYLVLSPTAGWNPTNPACATHALMRYE